MPRRKTAKNFPENTRKNIIKDYNEGKLKIVQILVKYGISQGLLYNIVNPEKKPLYNRKTEKVSVQGGSILVSKGSDTDQFVNTLFQDVY